MGFQRTRQRRWVDNTTPTIRKIFEFQPLKGLSYSARWGFSLDFVPIRKGGCLRWKRTAKTAQFDLCIDPIDNEGGPHDWCSVSLFIFPGKAYDWSKVTRAVKNTTAAAKADLARVETISDIAALFEQRSIMKFHRFSPENYVQTHLAWGLCLKAIGEREKGEMHLQEYCNRFSIARGDRILRQAEQNARMAFVT